TIFIEGEEVHGIKAVERAIKTMNAIDPDFTSTLLADNETAATKENTYTVYHGTHENNLTFINREVKNYNSIGTYFTSNRNYARSLYGSNVIPAAITLSNPLIVNNVNDCESFDTVFYDDSLTTLTFKDINKLLLDSTYISKLKDKYISLGHDGIIFQDSRIDLSLEDKEAHSVYIVFNAENISKIN